MSMDIFEWITPTVVITVAVLVWRHQIRLEKRSEQRFDRVDERFDRTDTRFDFLAREVTTNGRGIARLEDLHENPHRHIAVAE